MASNFVNLFRRELVRISCVRYVHEVYGQSPEVALNLKQRLATFDKTDPEADYKVNIGFKLPKLPSIRELSKELPPQDKSQKSIEADVNISLKDVEDIWKTTRGPVHIHVIADHYGIYNDLFGDAYFYPCVPLDIKFCPNSSEVSYCVYRGNVVKPSEASVAPDVCFEAPSDTLWTLVLTNPDGHFTDQESEYVHWFIGNIPGNDIKQGEVIFDYLQPFPARGTGYHRFIFVLYKQEGRVDYSSLKQNIPCLELEKRTFKTQDFYRSQQDILTPAGLAFFQSDWDLSLPDFFHNVLDMREPVFEYDFRPPYIAPPTRYPKKKPFNLYMDNRRDPKEIAKEYLLEKFKNSHPFEKPAPPLKHPNAHSYGHDLPSWLEDKLVRDRVGRGRINDY